MFSANVLHDVVSAVNEAVGTDYSIAITGYNVTNIPTPITKMLMSFTSDKQTVTLNPETQQLETELRLRMKSFIPVNQSVIVSRSAVENNLYLIAHRYESTFVSYQIEPLTYDDDIKCYTITSYVNFKDAQDL